jgi:hypothetical protein
MRSVQRLEWSRCLMVAAVFSAGCSQAASGVPVGTRTGAGGPEGVGAPTAPPEGTSSGARSDWAVTLSIAPWSQCTVHPEGIPNDPTRSARISADAKGTIRFSPPPARWGTRLSLSCAVDPAPPVNYVVDLNDPTTFARRSTAELVARKVGVRPAFQGDPMAVTAEELRREGYGLRPNPVRAPRMHARWLQTVSKPFDIYEGSPVSQLDGAYSAASYVGTTNSNWSALSQSANGFTLKSEPASGFNFPIYVTSTSNILYWTFQSWMNVPSSFNCNGASCDTGLWSGIGGGWTASNNTTPSSLIQAGLSLAAGAYQPFFEFYPNNRQHFGSLPPGDFLEPGDEVDVYAYASKSGNCQAYQYATDGTAPFACFQFSNDTRSWTIFGFSPYPTAPDPLTGMQAPYFPSLFSFAAEVRDQNVQYGTATMSGVAYDLQQNAHYDSGDTTGTCSDTSCGPGDPYIITTQPGSNGQPLSTVTMGNGQLSPPADPITFTFQQSQ